MRTLEACGDSPYVAVVLGRTSEANENWGYGVDVYGIGPDSSVTRLSEDARASSVTISNDASSVYWATLPTEQEVSAAVGDDPTTTAALARYNLKAIQALDAESGEEKQLTIVPGVTSIDLSADGTTLALTADTGPISVLTGDLSDVASTLQFTIPLETPEERVPLISTPQPREVWLSDVRWSPDGRHLSYVSEQGMSPTELHVFDTTTGEDRILLGPDDASNLGGYSWSPDGTRLLVTRYVYEGGVSSAAEVNVADGSITEIGHLEAREISYADESGNSIVGFIEDPAGSKGDIMRLWIRDEATGQLTVAASTHTEVKYASNFHVAACAI